MRNGLIIALLAILAAVAVGCGTKPPMSPVGNQSPGSPSGQQVAEVTTPKVMHGPASAKVKVDAYYPLNEKHLKIVEFLNSLADRYPDKVQVTAWDFRTDEGGKKATEAFGKICGGMRINGKSDFTVMLKGKKSPVNITGGEWINWTKPEVEAALDQVVKQVYPGTVAVAAPKK